jgi:sugar transferase (PEP-CTERM/EpsH1 system associated)
MEKGIATVIKNSISSFKHTIICLTKSGMSKKLLPKQIEIIEMNKKEGNSLFFVLRLAKTIKKLSPDIVHTRNWGGFDGVIAAKLAGIKHIFHGEHGWSIEDPYGLNKKRVFIRRILDRFVSCYTCVSKRIENWLINEIKVKKPVIQIYNGVDCDLYVPGDGARMRSDLGIKKNTMVFGIVARLDPIKNHKALITVFNDINKVWQDTCLLVAGTGTEEKDLQSIASHDVHFLGNRSDIPDLLRSLDVFVLPSFNEGISNTILEAMASGLPVVASDRGGNPELVKSGRNGMLFDPDSEGALKNCLTRYVQDSALRKYHGSNGRKMAQKLYSINTMVYDYKSAWKKNIENRF